MTQRWKITVEYDGAEFAGWQRQSHVSSVQQSIEEAIEKFSGETVTVHGAGRTDAGVHALGQVAHFDLEKDTNAKTVRDAINAHLGEQRVAVLSAEKCDGEFHARFDAFKRTYLYRIVCRRSPPVLRIGQVWHVKTDLDVAAMHEAAQVLVGKHDFTSFRATECQSESPVKTLDRLDVVLSSNVIPAKAGILEAEKKDPCVRRDDGFIMKDEIHIHAEARSFLHHQIRNITGTLKLVGEGKWTSGDVQRALDAKDRCAAGPTAPPEGLYLVGVDY